MSKKYRLFKRADDGAQLIDNDINRKLPGWKERFWHFQFQYAKKRYPRCLETADAGLALAKAKRLAAEIKTAIQMSDEKRLAGTKLRQAIVSTLGEIIIIYRARARIKSSENNITSLYSILRRVIDPNLTPEAIGKLSSNILTKKLLRDYQDIMVKSAAPDDDAKRTAITTCNSTIRQARSLFKRELTDDGVYAEDKIRLPDLKGFRSLKLFPEPKHSFVPIPSEMIDTIWQKSGELRTTNPNAYRAFLLTECCGLRRAEVARLRWDDIKVFTEQIEGKAETTYLIRLGVTKNGEPRLVPVEPDVYNDLKNLTNLVMLPTAAAADVASGVSPESPRNYILEGPYTRRHREAFDDLSHWLKTLGWTRRKKAHELRKHCGAQIAEKYGTRIGALILGNDEAVFRAHYDAALNMPKIKIFRRQPTATATTPEIKLFAAGA